MFVSADIDYANEYAKRYKNNESSNIYLVKLKADTKIFDAKKYEDFSAFNKYPDNVKEYFNSKPYYDAPKDIFLRFRELIEYYDSAKRADFDEEKYFNQIRNWGFSLESNDLERYMNRFAAICYFRKRDPSLFASNKSMYEQIVRLRSIFCEDLKEAGFQAFASEEFVHGKWHGRAIGSKRVIGIFDSNALESVEPISLNKIISTKAIRALGRDENAYGGTAMFFKKNYNRSNKHIQKFIDEIPTTESNNNESIKPGIFHGYFIYTDKDEIQKVWTKEIKIDYGIKGTARIAITYEDESEVRFKHLKFHEDTMSYGPDLEDGESIGHIQEINYGKWTKGPGLGVIRID